MGNKTDGFPRSKNFLETDVVLGDVAGEGTRNVEFGAIAEFVQQRPSNTNLLINHHFSSSALINQREVKGTISDSGYFIDCWKLISGSVTLSDSGLNLDGVIEQILENGPSSSDVFKASFLTDSGIQDATYTPSTKTFQIKASKQIIKAAKLELGKWQTLAHKEGNSYVLNDPPPIYQQELAKCQRYQMAYKYKNMMGWAVPISNTRVFFNIPVPMYTNPTIITTGGDNTIRVVSANRNTNKLITYKIPISDLYNIFAASPVYAEAAYDPPSEAALLNFPLGPASYVDNYSGGTIILDANL